MLHGKKNLKNLRASTNSLCKHNCNKLH